MDKKTFEIADPIMDEVAAAATTLLESPETATIRDLLTKLNKAIGDRYNISLALNVEVFDREKEQSLPLLQTGLSGFDGRKPYPTSNDVPPQQFILDGETVVVPGDRCPRCWTMWDKAEKESCGHCGATLGGDVTMLPDTDGSSCCENGKASASGHQCGHCGCRADHDG